MENTLNAKCAQVRARASSLSTTTYTEKQIEHTLKTETQKRGGLCWKFVSPSTTGVPDRLILLPQGRAALIELKTTGQKPRPIQTHRLNQIRALGHHAYLIDHPNQIPGILNEIQAT